MNKRITPNENRLYAVEFAMSPYMDYVHYLEQRIRDYEVSVTRVTIERLEEEIGGLQCDLEEAESDIRRLQNKLDRWENQHAKSERDTDFKRNLSIG